MDNKKIGDYISQLRRNKNLTQKDLADSLGITDKAVSKWERGVGYPDISMLKPLADMLGTSVNELLEGEENINEPEISGNELNIALDYADQLVTSKENKYGKIIAFILAIALTMAVCTSFIVNVAVNHTLSWSLLVLDGCVLAACLFLPLLLNKKQGLLYSLCFLTILILPFLGVIEGVVSGSVTSSGWLWGIGFPVSVTWLIIFWVLYLLFKKSKLNIWFLCSIGLFLCIPGEFITNYTIDLYTHFSRDPIDRFVNYATNTFAILAAVALCLIIGIYSSRMKKKSL